MLFISHRLEEVFAICQRATVMRDGKHVLTGELAGLTAADLVRAMVGRELAARPPEAGAGTPGEAVLTVERLTREGVFTDISFTVRSGEIVALAGLVGVGAQRGGAGRVRHRPVRRGHGHGARAGPAQGVADRPRWPRGSGSFPRTAGSRAWSWTCPCSRTSRSPRSAGSGRAGSSGPRRERALAADWAVRLKIKYGRLTDPVAMLSGGNQQKVVLAKWLGRNPAVLIVDEPTRGIDVGTKAEVHHLLAELAARRRGRS